MPVAWHPKRWGSFCVSENEKKEIEPIFTERLQKCALVVYNMEVLKHFGRENFLVWFGQNVSKYLKQFSIKNYR